MGHKVNFTIHATSAITPKFIDLKDSIVSKCSGLLSTQKRYADRTPPTIRRSAEKARSISLLQQFCQWLYDSSIGTGIRESIWVFPIIETVHVLAITLLVGTIAILDLRLLGLALKREPVSRVASGVLPLTWAGFAVMFKSGRSPPGGRSQKSSVSMCRDKPKDLELHYLLPSGSIFKTF
jgi:hypothetical protein